MSLELHILVAYTWTYGRVCFSACVCVYVNLRVFEDGMIVVTFWTEIKNHGKRKTA